MKLPNRLFLAGVLLVAAPLGMADQPRCADPSSTMLWEVQGEDSRVQLFGSVHLGDPDFYPLPKVIERGFRNADHLVFELDPRSMNTQAAQQQLLDTGRLPSGETLSDRVSPEVMDDLRTRLESLGLPADNFMGFRPWVLTIMLSTLQYTSLGYLPEHGVELYLLEEAAGEANVLELESLESQLEYLQGMDGEAFLAYTLAEFEAGRELAGKLVEAWRCADKEALAGLFAEGFEVEGPMAEDMDQLRDELIVERNRFMADGIAQYLKEGSGHYFVTVGSAHYLGDDSIIELLENEGYEVEPVRR